MTSRGPRRAEADLSASSRQLTLSPADRWIRAYSLRPGYAHGSVTAFPRPWLTSHLPADYESMGSRTGYGNTGSRADDLAGSAPAQAWKRLSAGDGAKGPRLYDWAMATLPITREPVRGSSGGC